MKLLSNGFIVLILALHLIETAQAIECYECSTDSNENCLVPDSNKTENQLTTTCSSDVTMCFTQIQNGEIIRGCMTNENENDLSSYQTCSTSMCNGEEIEKEFCIVCNSDTQKDCTHDPSTKMAKQCPLSIKRQGCLLYQKEPGSVRRDCMSTDQQLRDLCLNEEDNTCKYCYGDECNKKRYVTLCHKCRSDINPDCVNSPKLTDLQTCKKYVDDCYTHIDNRNIVSRGCFGEFPSDQYDCTNKDTCSRCTGDNSCNDISIKIESCITCNSTDPDCKNYIPPRMLRKCRLSMETTGCYSYEENDEIQRGCMSEIEDEEFRKKCELKNNKSDKIEEIVDNEQKPTKQPTDFQKCLTGEYSDSQNNDTATFESKTCTNQVDECYTHVANNVIRKGCLSDAKNFLSSGIDIETDCKNPDICEKCSGSIDCNNKNIKKELCTVCHSEDEPDCKFWPSNSMRNQCPLSIRPFGCLTHINGTTVQRDCMSTNSKLRELCLSKNESCKHCFGDECNKERSVLSCRNCISQADDGENCIAKPWFIESKICKTFVDECFTHINDDGVVTRGCLDDFESIKENCTNDDTCLRCNNSEIVCNGMSIKAESCISCDSADNSNCKSNVTLENAAICPQKTIQRLGCYHFINEIDGNTKRGCISTLSSHDRTIALKQTNGWKTCDDNDNCNSVNSQTQLNPPSSTTTSPTTTSLPYSPSSSSSSSSSSTTTSTNSPTTTSLPSSSSSSSSANRISSSSLLFFAIVLLIHSIP